LFGSSLNADLVGRAVFDGRGVRIGQLVTVYTDVDTDAMDFAGVQITRRGRRRAVLVPLTDAILGPARITVRCGRDLARSAPSVRVGDLLPADDEPQLFAHYDIDYHPAHDGARRLTAR
jgi:hypothetical protein